MTVMTLKVLFKAVGVIGTLACVWLLGRAVLGDEAAVVETTKDHGVDPTPVVGENRTGEYYPVKGLTELEKGIVEVLETMMVQRNITLWPVGGTLIHLLRHGRFSDYEEHDQEFDLDLAMGVEEDLKNFTQEGRQWVVDVLSAKGILRRHKLTSKKSQAGTGTCRNRKDNFIQCKHLTLPLKFDLFLGRPPSPTQIFYSPLGTQPRALLYPTQPCKAWHTTIPCPAKPYDVLKIWGVQTGYEAKEGCLLFPRHLQKQIANFEKLPPAVKTRLQEETRALIRKAKNLRETGHASFHDQVATDVECKADIEKVLGRDT
eukprot:TRINITY_DN9650_c0_g1_i1.p1 TRINITY_DN9650_c0_g1~~TRINITY_DN9650_c0_g1_i1.p1  ORF type:complete len:316 (+),score=35.96 TRINITY_DN9650_c0_g1_i1:611-1558(+)